MFDQQDSPVWTDSSALSRRQLLQGAVGIGAGAALSTSAILAAGSGIAAVTADAKPNEPISVEEAVARLKAGNERFVNGNPRHNHTSRDWRARLTKAQHPFATVLSCSDSRVPPELLFDCGFGDLFTIRVAGNVIAEDILGTLQYASYHLHTPLFLVLGHEGCGAVTAAVSAMLGDDKEPEDIRHLLEMITPGLTKLNRKLPREELIAQAVVANVDWSQQQILRLPKAAEVIQKNQHQLRGAVYSLKTSRVKFL